MNSVTGHTTGHSIAAEVRMQRQVHKGAFLLLEGATDLKRIRKILDRRVCCPIICFGKDKVVDAVKRIGEDDLLGVAGMIDADFDRPRQTLVQHEMLIVSRTHDYDMDMLTTNALTRYFLEVSTQPSLASSPDDSTSQKILTDILESIRLLSALRYANVRDQLGYKLSDLKLEKFYDGHQIDLDQMIDDASRGKFSDPASKAKLRSIVSKYAALPLDLYQISSGHDACGALGICLRARLGKRETDQTTRSEIEIHMRLTLDPNDFRECGLIENLKAWEEDNTPYRILVN